MSTTTVRPFTLNQTASLIETSTGLDNFTRGYHPGYQSELQRNTVSSVERWADIASYKYTSWTIMLIITVIGVIGNTLVFIMMGDTKLRYLSYSVYLKSLAVSDSCLLIAWLFRESEKLFFVGQLAEMNFCILSFTLRNLLMMTSPWLVVGLTLDRYICVSFPLSRKRLCTRIKAIIVCSTILGLSVVSILPFPFKTKLVRGQCFPAEDIKYYYIAIRLFSSILPCLFILVLNILIIIQIQRSHNFRNTFMRSTTDSANRQHDSSTRPLVLVSILAFVTLIPVALSEAVRVALLITDKDFVGLTLIANIGSICFLIYFLNFGQNFYILIGSSSNYREIIRKRLSCFSLKRNQEGRLSQAMAANIPATNSGTGSGTTGLSLASATSGERSSGIDGSTSDVMS